MMVSGQLHAKAVFTVLHLPRKEAPCLLKRGWMDFRADMDIS